MNSMVSMISQRGRTSGRFGSKAASHKFSSRVAAIGQERTLGASEYTYKSIRDLILFTNSGLLSIGVSSILRSMISGEGVLSAAENEGSTAVEVRAAMPARKKSRR